jgi:hypothetical protein
MIPLALTPFSMYLIMLGAMLIVPVIPAFILFKFVKSTAATKGSQYSMQFGFGGAFAGYAFVFLLLYMRLPEDPNTLATEEIWEFNGKVVDVQGNSIDPNAKPFVELVPPVEILPNGCFSLKLVADKNNNQPKLNYCIRVQDRMGLYDTYNSPTLTEIIRNFQGGMHTVQLPDIKMNVTARAIASNVDTLNVSN